jgi:hypothetical protein
MDEIAITGGMTADRLQSIALRLGNSCWCRHWLHWNYPRQDPWLMAVSCFDYSGPPTFPALVRRGFTLERLESGLIVYTVPRLDGAGNPFRSEL